MLVLVRLLLIEVLDNLSHKTNKKNGFKRNGENHAEDSSPKMGIMTDGAIAFAGHDI